MLQRRVVGDGASCLVGYASKFGKCLGVRRGGGPDPTYPNVISYHIISSSRIGKVIFRKFERWNRKILEIIIPKNQIIR